MAGRPGEGTGGHARAGIGRLDRRRRPGTGQPDASCFGGLRLRDGWAPVAGLPPQRPDRVGSRSALHRRRPRHAGPGSLASPPGLPHGQPDGRARSGRGRNSMTISRPAALALAAVLASPVAGPAAAQEQPANPECIAPSDPGGGWDFTCRTVGRILTEEGILDQQVQVVNLAGGVGAVAYALVTGKRADDPNLFVAGSTVGITQIAQGKYPADEDAVRWLAMLGADAGVVLVQPTPRRRTWARCWSRWPLSRRRWWRAARPRWAAGTTCASCCSCARRACRRRDLGRVRWVQFDGGQRGRDADDGRLHRRGAHRHRRDRRLHRVGRRPRARRDGRRAPARVPRHPHGQGRGLRRGGL